jgi:hypothetical protein
MVPVVNPVLAGEAITTYIRQYQTVFHPRNARPLDSKNNREDGDGDDLARPLLRRKLRRHGKANVLIPMVDGKSLCGNSGNLFLFI